RSGGGAGIERRAQKRAKLRPAVARNPFRQRPPSRSDALARLDHHGSAAASHGGGADEEPSRHQNRGRVMDAGRRLSLNLRLLAALGAFAGGAACFSAAVDAAAAQTARPYLPAAPADAADADRGRGARTAPPPTAQQSARSPVGGDAFVGGVKLFAPSPGRIYEVGTAPLRVTVLLLPPGETVIAKAAGDTVRWRIAETSSGQGAAARTQVLIKPLSAGLETNLVLSTNRQVYLLHLRSGSAKDYY